MQQHTKCFTVNSKSSEKKSCNLLVLTNSVEKITQIRARASSLWHIESWKENIFHGLSKNTKAVRFFPQKFLRYGIGMVLWPLY